MVTWSQHLTGWAGAGRAVPRGLRWPVCRVPGQAAPGPRIPVLAPEQAGVEVTAPGSRSSGHLPVPTPHHSRASTPPCPTDSAQLGAAAAERRPVFLGFGVLFPRHCFVRLGRGPARPQDTPSLGLACWSGARAGNEWCLTLCSRRAGGSVLGRQLCPAVPGAPPSTPAAWLTKGHGCGGPFGDPRL